MLFEMIKKHGATKTIKEKLKSGTVFYDVVAAMLNGTDKTSLELIRLGEINRAKKKLKRRFWPKISEPLSKEIVAEDSNVVWTLWLQGEKDAPKIVKTAIKSIKKAYNHVFVLDAENFTKYSNLPEFIVNKWKNGEISNAHFSDLLRTDLLVEHGGTWIDSTTIIQHKSDWLENKIEGVPLFFFQNLRPGSMGNAIFLSNWFIKAQKGEPSLLRLRELLYAYWEKTNKLEDYFIYHIFWHLIFEAHPETLERVPRVDNSLPLELMYRLNDEMTINQVKQVFVNFPIQKVTYKSLSADEKAAHFILENSFAEMERLK